MRIRNVKIEITWIHPQPYRYVPCLLDNNSSPLEYMAIYITGKHQSTIDAITIKPSCKLVLPRLNISTNNIFFAPFSHYSPEKDDLFSQSFISICVKLSFAISRCQDICVSYLRLHPQLTSLTVRVSLCWDLHSYHPITF